MATIKITGVWKQQADDGRKYYSGKTQEDITIPAGSMIWVNKNDYKEEGDNKPDLNIGFSPPRDAQDQPAAAAKTGTDDDW